jgi:hypothetical protein
VTAPGLTGSWLAARLGTQPARIEAMRRSGELVGVRHGGEYVYPAWQFDRDWRPLPDVQRLVDAARAAGIDGDRLHRLVTMRSGLTASGRPPQRLDRESADRVLRAINPSA